ncbi:hypothetical protein L228DRAFT_246665 [Xylona heveae TC161]|uniref:Uncharacterized protein n=1 Tax=Xylona heveae (strain CBS 132557 / TC161) TaxID=1328760 RepID=A0A165HQ11_XYLHT|nr:hypothetical protein L228DRAFT_246665 [Xylona heveae TC161]KZF23819.1 hypothetical protein L228DRAFT_246665 [Xylona heveae TC161]
MDRSTNLQQDTNPSKLAKRPLRNHPRATQNPESSSSLSSRIASSASGLARDTFTNQHPSTASSTFASALSNGSKGQQASSSSASQSEHFSSLSQPLTGSSSSLSASHDAGSGPAFQSFRSQPSSSHDQIHQDFEQFFSKWNGDNDVELHGTILEDSHFALPYPGQTVTQPPQEKHVYREQPPQYDPQTAWYYHDLNAHLINHQHVQHQQYIIDQRRQKSRPTSPQEMQHGINPQDGAEVVKLLADPNLNLEDVPSSSFAEADSLAQDQHPYSVEELFHHNIPKEEVERIRTLFPPPPEHRVMEQTNPVDMVPEFGEVDGRRSMQDSPWTSAYRSPAEREQWLNEWEGVLNRYTDEVWGDLLPIVKDAREEIEQARKDDHDTMAGRAVRRLGLILAHL